MVSDASKKKAAQKKAAAAAKRGGKAAAAAASSKLAEDVGSVHISDRTCTGVLCSHPLSRDINVSVFQFWLLDDRSLIPVIYS